MIIRNGFVSNSSSTSFCIYGADLNDYNDTYDFNSLLEKFQCEDVWGFIEKMEARGLFASTGPDGGCCFVGRSWDSITDDETGAAFKTDVKDQLAKVVGKEVKCTTITEAWRDG